MTVGDREISRTPDRERLVQDKLEQHLNVSEWELCQAVTKRLASVREEIRKLPAPESALALARCEPHPAADARDDARQCARTGRGRRAALSKLSAMQRP